MTLPGLGVVVPVYNERDWVAATLARLRAALGNSPWADAEVVVVDDGSTDGSAEILDELAAAMRLTVVHQPNGGRLAARAAGLGRLDTDLALLVDARVHVSVDALAYLARELEADPSATVWNGDVTVETRHNPYAGFWAALTAVGWRAYLGNRRRTSFGLEDFDRYPKGTTFFLAPRRELLTAGLELNSHFDDRRYASDDTALLRALAARHRIQLAPQFHCTYHGRDAVLPFVRHAFFRGTTFVDSYVGRGGLLGRLTIAVVALSPFLVIGAVAWPVQSVGVVLVGMAALGLLARRCGARGRDAVALAGLSPVFGAVFGAGLLRGLGLAGAARLRRQAS